MRPHILRFVPNGHTKNDGSCVYRLRQRKINGKDKVGGMVSVDALAGRITRLFRFRYTIKLYRYRVIARIVTPIKFTSGWHGCYWNQSNKLYPRIGSGHAFSTAIYAAIKIRQLVSRETRFTGWTTSLPFLRSYGLFGIRRWILHVEIIKNVCTNVRCVSSRFRVTTSFIVGIIPWKDECSWTNFAYLVTNRARYLTSKLVY